MANNKKHVAFPGKVVILGFGSIGQATLPLLLRHIDLQPSQVIFFFKQKTAYEIAKKYGIQHVKETLTRKNYEAALDPYLAEGGFLVNVSVEVESLALMKYCRAKKILYIDTVTEPWPGRTEDLTISPSRRSNYALREEVLAFGRQKE